jgi:hypothetical protein
VERKSSELTNKAAPSRGFATPRLIVARLARRFQPEVGVRYAGRRLAIPKRNVLDHVVVPRDFPIDPAPAFPSEKQI